MRASATEEIIVTSELKTPTPDLDMSPGSTPRASRKTNKQKKSGNPSNPYTYVDREGGDVITKNPYMPNIIIHPAHYIEGRLFEPISFIEEYGLYHHLACVVKYIARAGRKTSLLNDLCKAHWYLDREIVHRQQGKNSCIPALNTKPYTIQEILDDWELSANLSACLSYILDSWLLKDRFKSFLWISKLSSNQALSPTAHNADFLIRALGFLQSELSKQVAEEHS